MRARALIIGGGVAGKAGLASLSHALRVELASWRIAVVPVESGTTATEIFAFEEFAREGEARAVTADRLCGPRVAAAPKGTLGAAPLPL